MRLGLMLAVGLWLAAFPATAHADEVVKTGAFYDGPHAPQHRVSGRAELIKQPDGSHVLNLHGFVSDAGPDVYIILSTAREPRDDGAILTSDFVTIGPRQALSGDQTYALPAGVDPAHYHSVGIWCQQYTVLFGAAALTDPWCVKLLRRRAL